MVIALAWLVWMVFYFAIIFVLIEGDNGSTEPPPAFWFSMATMCCPILISFAWILYGFYGAIRTWMGNDFRYILIGHLVDGIIVPAV